MDPVTIGRIVDAIIADLSGRHGFDQVWDKTDNGMRRVIRARWEKLVAEVVEVAHPFGGIPSGTRIEVTSPASPDERAGTAVDGTAVGRLFITNKPEVYCSNDDACPADLHVPGCPGIRKAAESSFWSCFENISANLAAKQSPSYLGYEGLASKQSHELFALLTNGTIPPNAPREHLHAVVTRLCELLVEVEDELPCNQP